MRLLITQGLMPARDRSAFVLLVALISIVLPRHCRGDMKQYGGDADCTFGYDVIAG